MSLDFLVCLKDSTIVAAVELDDKTHERVSRKQAYPDVGLLTRDNCYGW